MIEIKKHIGEGFAGGELSDTLIQMQLEAGMLPISGRTYFVNKLGNGTTGLSWANAFTTIEAAITASNVNIVLTENVGGKNRIFIDGGNYTETIVQLPFRCDMIGVGGQPVRIMGATHIATGPTGFGSCHMYNIQFYNVSATVPIFQIDSDLNWTRVEWHNCLFQSASGLRPSIGLQIGKKCQQFKVDNCQVRGNPPATIGIQMDGSNCDLSDITNCYINAVSKGIVFVNDGYMYGGLIKNNVISDAFGGGAGTSKLLIGIDILSDSKVMIVDNFISAVDAIHFANASPYTKALTVGNNIVQGADGSEDGSIETA